MKDQRPRGSKSGKVYSASLDTGSGVADELTRASILHQRGDLAAATSVYRKILSQDPHQFQANHFLGVIELQSGRPRDALALIAMAIEIDPNSADAHLNMGAVHMALGMADDALRSFDHALKIRPKWGLAWNNRGNALRALKRPEHAHASYHTALECDPSDPRTHCNLGIALRDLHRREEALLSFEKSLAIKPDYALALRNYGDLLKDLKRPEDALACYGRALKLSPNDPAVLIPMGNVLLGLWRPDEAVRCFESALALDPNLPEALNNGGIAYLNLGNYAAALDYFDRLLRISPRVAGFLSNRGEALLRLNRYGEAAETYSTLCAIAPDFELASGKLFHARQMVCEWSTFTALSAELKRGVADGRKICAPFDFLAVSDDPAAQRECAQTYAARLGPPSIRSAKPESQSGGSKKLRLAYVSGDFGNRPVAHLLVGVLEQHDRETFETIGISLRPPDSTETGKRIIRSLDRLIDVSHKSDRDVCALMAELDVHIAVDLMGFTHGSRPAIFFNRVAPIQVAYLGFPATSGSTCMDYIIADDFLIPEASRSAYAEHVVYMPDCFQANDNLRHVGPAPTRRQAGLPQAAFVFCSFNNTYKLNPTIFEIWCRLLLARPNSVLWLVGDAPEIQLNLRREAAQRGIAAERVIFADRVGYHEHLARQPLADLFLDTLPFNAGTTASDALWAGLPVLTCARSAFASRMAGSLLRIAGCPELITHSLKEYEERALGLSAPGSELKELRERLATLSRQGPLFDTSRFTRHLECAYLEMWRLHAHGVGPATIRVADIHTAEQ